MRDPRRYKPKTNRRQGVEPNKRPRSEISCEVKGESRLVADVCPGALNAGAKGALARCESPARVRFAAHNVRRCNSRIGGRKSAS